MNTAYTRFLEFSGSDSFEPRPQEALHFYCPFYTLSSTKRVSLGQPVAVEVGCSIPAQTRLYLTCQLAEEA